MKEYLTYLIMQKGIQLGFGVGLLQVMKSIQDNTFKWRMAITTMLGSTIVGYVAFHIGETSGIGFMFNAIWTIFSSANTFLIIGVISDKDFAENIIQTFISNKVK